MTNKLLTGNIHATDIETAERAAIFKLRELVPKLSTGEVIALAIVLTHSYAIAFGRRVGVTANQGFSQDLTNALFQVQTLSSTNKLTIAIELLQQIQDRNTQSEDEKNSP